jgi:glycine cleavage system H protein
VENAVKSLTSTGAIAYIPKPFTADELLAIVNCSLRCSTLLEEADSAGLEHSRAMSYVPSPANYYRLGHISWALMEDEGTARIGVSDLFMKSIDGIREFELATTGDELLQGIPCGQATTLDGLTHEIMCPLSGQVIEVNDDASSNPSLVEKDPYFRGWLYRVLPTNPKSDLQWLSL